MTINKYQKPSLQTQDEALKISKGTQRPAQTKEQTKLIAQGIQKGIDLYKKQQKEKARELSKKLKKTARQKELSVESDDNEVQEYIIYRQHWLPWVLLVMTWVSIGIYFHRVNLLG
jgi:hypothetical protein